MQAEAVQTQRVSACL